MSQDVLLDFVGRRAQRADGDPWGEFNRRFAPRILGGIQGALRRAGTGSTRDRVEDLLQEVYCRLLENDGHKLRRCRGRAEGEVGAYLRRVAENVVFDQLRSRAAVKRGRDQVVDLGAAEGESLAERTPAPCPSPEEELLARERRQRLLLHCREAASRRSKERDLRIFELALLEGWSSREIAAEVGGLSPSSVDSIVHRLKRRLAERGLMVPRRG